MDYKIATWRVKRDFGFASIHGDVNPPRNAEAWSMIMSGQGANERHLMCGQGRHDFEWCSNIMEHVRFFCLEIQPLQSDDEEPVEQTPQAMSEMDKGKKRKREGAFEDRDDEQTTGAGGKSSKEVGIESSKGKDGQAEEDDEEAEEEVENGDEEAAEGTEAEDEEADGDSPSAWRRPDRDSDGKSFSEDDSIM